MTKYLGSLGTLESLDLNKLLVIDRVKWETMGIDIKKLLSYVETEDEAGYYNYLNSFLKTELQQRNLSLVWKTSYVCLVNRYKELINNVYKK